MAKHSEVNLRKFIKYGQRLPSLEPSVFGSRPPPQPLPAIVLVKDQTKCSHSCDSTGHMLSVLILAEQEHGTENVDQTGCVLLVPGS